MTILWFLLGIAIILGIARYNESDSLFWKLLVSFVGAYGAAVLVSNYVQSKEKKDRIEIVCSAPMQATQAVSHSTAVFPLPTLTKPMAKPASQDKPTAIIDSTSSKVSGNNNRDQPIPFDTS